MHKHLLLVQNVAVGRFRAEVAVAKVANSGNHVKLFVNFRIERGRDDLHLRERVRNRVDANFGHQQRGQHDVLLGDVVIEQDADRHNGRRSRRHGRVHQDDAIVLDVLGKTQIIQFRFAGQLVRLDEDLADPDVLANVADGLLHGLAGAQNRHAANLLAGQPFALVRNVLGRFHLDVLERKQRQGVLQDQPDEPFRVEDKLIPWRARIPDERVQALDLGRRWQQLERVRHRLANVRMGKSFPQLEASQLQLRVDMLDNQLDRDHVAGSARNDNIRVCHRRRNVIAVRRLHHRRVLFQHTLQIPPTLLNVPLQTPRQTDVRIRVHKDLHVQHFHNLRVVKRQNPLKYNHIRTVHRLGVLLARVRHKIVHRNLNLPALLQPLQHVLHQFDVERVRMVKVVLVPQRLVVLLLVQNLVKTVHRQQRHPRNIQALDDLLRDRRLAGSAPTANT